MKSLSASALLLSLAYVSVSAAQPPASSQQRREADGSIAVVLQGDVVDTQGAAVVGAAVTLTPAHGHSVTLRTGAGGFFSSPPLLPGESYAMEVAAPGFATYRQAIPPARLPVQLHIRLAIEADTASVTVVAEEARVSVDPDSEAGSLTLSGGRLATLADDPDELARQLAALAGVKGELPGDQLFVDGFSNGQLPPKSAIREVRVNADPYSAQYDRPGTGRVEVFTRPGTDKLHGTMSLEGMDRAFNTSNPLLHGGTQPDYHQVFLTGSVTGSAGHSLSYNLSGSNRVTEENSIFSGTVASLAPGSTVLCNAGAGTAACSANPLPPSARATFTPRTRSDISPRIDLSLGKNNTFMARFTRSVLDVQKNGVGELNLPSTGHDTHSHFVELQLSDTAVLGKSAVNEARLDLYQRRASQVPLSTAPSFNVIGSFVGGGAADGAQSLTLDRLEAQDLVSQQLREHLLHFGFRSRSARQAQYSNANANGTFSYRTIADYLLSNPFQYAVTTYANPRVSKRVTDAGLYVEDEWKLRPNLTLVSGLRLEAQSVIHSSHDIAPRLSLHYAIPRKGGSPVTTLRFGYGVFYERFGIDTIITSVLQNGSNSAQRLSRAAGAGVLAGCSPQALALCTGGTTSPATVYALADDLRSAYQSQFGFAVEQQLARSTVVSASYLFRRGVHQYFSRSLPGNAGNLRYEFQSGGYTRHEQLVLNARSQLTPRFSVSGFAQFNRVHSNTNGATSFQTDSLHPAVDDGAPTYWNRAWTYASADWQAPPLGIAVSPYLFASTGDVYSITTGVDTNGDSIINDRAAFAPGAPPNASCLNPANFIAPPIGTADYARTPAGYCTGPAGVTVNTRLLRAFHLGPVDRSAGAVRRYTLSLGAQVFNVFNSANYARQNGNLSAASSGLFGRSQALQQGAFDSGSALRRVFLQASFTF